MQYNTAALLTLPHVHLTYIFRIYKVITQLRKKECYFTKNVLLPQAIYYVTSMNVFDI